MSFHGNVQDDGFAAVHVAFISGVALMMGEYLRFSCHVVLGGGMGVKRQNESIVRLNAVHVLSVLTDSVRAPRTGKAGSRDA
jgi:uncharacterized membrane protein AbrB (regulator of aidB expression)